MTTMGSILVVDDEERNRRLLQAVLQGEGYGVLLAENGETALALAYAHSPILILLDLMMPGMDGFEVTKRLKAVKETQAIPVIVITAIDDGAARSRALQAGASEVLTKPVQRLELMVRLRNLLMVAEYTGFLLQFDQRVATEAEKRAAEFRAEFNDTMAVLVQLAEHHQRAGSQHWQRLPLYVQVLGGQMGLPPAWLERVAEAAPLHDIGNIEVPQAVLAKTGALNSAEWALIKRHPEAGFRMLSRGKGELSLLGAEIALCHHERWDGSGYPRALQGERIPLSARLFSLCDRYDSLRMRRPYRAPSSHDQAVRLLVNGGGKHAPGHFAPEVLSAFGLCQQHFADIYQALPDEEVA